MSLQTITSGFLSIGPKVSLKNGQMVSASSWRVWLFGLGCFRKRITVNPDRSLILIERFWLWVFKSSRKISFDDVQRIDYDCKTIPTSWNLLNGAEDEIERYIVSLELENGKK